MEILALVESSQGRDSIGPESAVALADNLLQVGVRYLLVADVEAEDLKGQLLKGKVAPFGLPIGGEGGYLFGDEETTVVCEALEDYVFKGELAGFSA